MALAASLVAPVPVQALEGDRYTVTIGSSLTYDDNLYRLPNGQTPPASTGSTRRSDLATGLLLRGQTNLAIGRQRLRADLTGTNTRYLAHDTLDNRGGSGAVDWDWQMTSWWSGRLYWARSRSLSGFADLRTFEKNTNDVQRFGGEIESWVLPDWRAVAGVGAVKVDNSAASLSAAAQDNLVWNVGVRYQSGRASTVRVGLAVTDGRSPNQQVFPGAIVDNRFRQSDLGIDGSWLFSPATRLSGRLAYTRREHPQVAARDFSGVTGRAQFDWMLTGKTGVTLVVRREIGAVADLVSNYILTDAASVTPYWLATAKLRVEAGLEAQRRTFAGDPGIVLTDIAPREDELRNLSFAVGYAATRTVTMNASLVHGTRSSNRPGLQYRADTAALTAQIAW